MKNYKQLTVEQRYQIEALLQAGLTQTNISKQLGVHKSTVSRELKRSIPKRGRGSGKYSASNAEKKTRLRHHHKHKRVLFTSNMKQAIAKKMEKDKWSPELISEKWKQQGIPIVSHETIYKWIWESKHSNKLENKPYKLLTKNLNTEKDDKNEET